VPDESPQPKPLRRAAARKVRVVILVDGVGITGGGERFARELALRLDRSRFELTYCTSRPADPEIDQGAVAAALEELRASGAEVIELPRRSAADVLAWRPVLRILRKRRVDILHSHKFGSNVWGAILATLARTPVFIAHEQTWSYDGQPVRRFLDRELISRRADAFVAVSRADRRRMIEVEHVPEGKTLVIPNAVPMGIRDPDRDVRQELGIAANVPVVGTVCVLRPQKALDTMLDAFSRLRVGFPDCRLVIAGDGPERGRLEARAHALGLDEAALFLGDRNDVPDVLAAFDVFALSSDFEGTPLAVIEAMGAGVPVVATDVGGLPDLIDDGVHGRLVPARAPEALARVIREILSDPGLGTRLGAAARERQEREFAIEASVSRVETLYDDLYAGPGSTGRETP
jgi:glycosyltransferase involved in cell wall biosynthesis